MDVEFFLIMAGLVTLVAAIASLVRTRPHAAARLTHDFARKVDLGLDGATEPAVTARLVRRERAGAAGAVVVGVLAAAIAARADATAWESSRLFAVFIGYLAGHATGYGVVAWRESARPGPGDGPRLARASVPTHGDYVARHERVGAWVTAGLSVLAGAAFLIADGAGLLSGVVPAGLAVVAIVVPPAAVAVDELLARRLLDRPQPAASLSELAWDDALRARTLRDMVTVPLVTGYFAVVTLSGGLAPAAAGPAFLVLVAGGLVMAVVSVVIGPERHFRRRLWPTPTPPQAALAATGERP